MLCTYWKTMSLRQATGSSVSLYTHHHQHNLHFLSERAPTGRERAGSAWTELGVVFLVPPVLVATGVYDACASTVAVDSEQERSIVIILFGRVLFVCAVRGWGRTRGYR
ncbi:hypothetical protein EJ03DRAFT_134135 [Teratosphaeria nubilosa]|uniref:Uncharacterized protein n=1 Tax=Teratosphaeria nubilosa TaxID=161662 RepID=A0A6G1L5G4_9PEZI|nr:hypothetical protein EJ03DRAFT_134135 [Teratosphaeria nubilosa]